MTAERELRSGEVDYTVDDLKELARLSTPAPIRIARVFGWALFIIASVTFVLSRLMHTPYRVTDFLWALAAAIALAALGSPTLRAYIWRWQMRRSELYAPMTFTVRDSGFDIASAKGNAEIKWPVFRRMMRQGERLFLFVTKRSAYVVPRRAFDSDEAFDAFANAAQEFRGAE